MIYRFRYEGSAYEVQVSCLLLLSIYRDGQRTSLWDGECRTSRLDQVLCGEASEADRRDFAAMVLRGPVLRRQWEPTQEERQAVLDAVSLGAHGAEYYPDAVASGFDGDGCGVEYLEWSPVATRELTHPHVREVR